MYALLAKNDIIHITKHMVNVNGADCLYFTDYDNNNINSININQFINTEDKFCFLTDKITERKGKLSKNMFNRFVLNKIKNENYKIIIYI